MIRFSFVPLLFLLHIFFFWCRLNILFIYLIVNTVIKNFNYVITTPPIIEFDKLVINAIPHRAKCIPITNNGTMGQY